MGIKAFDVYLANLDPTIGLEIKKSRPCVVISPEKMNLVLGTIIIAPMTTTLRGYPSRVELRFQNKFCEVCLDQMRAVDESRLSKQALGRLRMNEIESIKDTVSDIFEL
ncbi:MAG TPA: type II toxin-antitoxin system PemK/MazF family toxin [Cyclobacteriaceae bacterium]|nr:type II toxin-antitoxin system PemK/MazF family toxin [Cyclobacteriaceae bacterium]